MDGTAETGEGGRAVHAWLALSRAGVQLDLMRVYPPGPASVLSCPASLGPSLGCQCPDDMFWTTSSRRLAWLLPVVQKVRTRRRFRMRWVAGWLAG